MSTLEISGLSLEWVTALWSSVLHSVKTLVIIDHQIEELPDSIVQMQNLERLKFECGSLKAVPNWIGQLNRLHTFQSMYEYDNGSFATQPDCIEPLGGLQKLSLRGCQNIKHLPNIVRQMEGLKHLDLLETGIVELPPWLGYLTNLTHLNLSTTHQNDDILPELSHLTSLEELDLSGRNFGSSLSCISNFPRLQQLNVSGSKQLRSIPHLSSSVLCYLDASNCTNLRELPDFSNLQSLGCLLLGGCNLLECIPGFKTIAENLSHLELPGPSGACSNLSDDFTNNVFMGALFGNLHFFKMKGNIIAGSHISQQCLSFLFPDVRFNKSKCSSLTLNLDMVSSPVDIKVITKDDLVLFETMLPANDFHYGNKTFSSFEEGNREILEHLSEGSGTIQVSTDVSELSRVELQAAYDMDRVPQKVGFGLFQ
ncbi:scrib Protein [Nymphaea thermarum]|nr:scrib Protein [Nymphaea thermarum]